MLLGLLGQFWPLSFLGLLGQFLRSIFDVRGQKVNLQVKFMPFYYEVNFLSQFLGVPKNLSGAPKYNAS